MRVVLAGSFLQVTLWAFHCDLLTGIGTDTSSLLLHAKECEAAWSTAKVIMRSVASLIGKDLDSVFSDALCRKIYSAVGSNFQLYRL